MRTQEEIQKAHDALISVLNGEVPVDLQGHARQIVEAQVDALCWALGDDSQSHFGRNLAQLNTALQRRGFVLTTREGGR